MKILITGGAKSGKSAFAENAAVSLSDGGNLYYLATLIPTDSEDNERIKKHLAKRDGKGFITVECGTDLTKIPSDVDKNSTFLLDSTTALLQNALFPIENNYELDVCRAERCKRDLLNFISSVKNIVIVGDNIYSDSNFYSESTEVFRSLLADIDRTLAAECDVVAEVFCAQPIFYKGEYKL